MPSYPLMVIQVARGAGSRGDDVDVVLVQGIAVARDDRGVAGLEWAGAAISGARAVVFPEVVHKSVVILGQSRPTTLAVKARMHFNQVTFRSRTTWLGFYQ
ncbi:MAG: hypothetical protein Kow0047_16910 [Anaerolineae bacterium]